MTNDSLDSSNYSFNRDVYEYCSGELSFYNFYPISTTTDDDCFRHRLKRNIHNSCSSCFALNFIEERKNGSKLDDPVFNKCCGAGTIPSTLMEVETPKFLFKHLTETDPKIFLQNIRSYNGQFAFTSSLANLDETLANMRDGVYTFRISGNVHHYYKRRLLMEIDEDPLFAQLYIYDQDYQTRMRSERMPILQSSILSQFTTYINEKNTFTNKLSSRESLVQQEDLHIGFIPDPLDKRCNIPVSD